MIDDDDPLWDPAAQADEDLARIQNLLGRYGVRARDLSLLEWPHRRAFGAPCPGRSPPALHCC